MATPFTLHGMPMSGATRRVAVIAKERNIPYVLNHVNLMQGEHKQDSYKAHQPFCQIPYISQEDGFEMFESRAIGRYLATQGSGPELVPTDPKARIVFEQAASIEYSQFDPVASLLSYEKLSKKKYYGKETNEALVEELVAKLSIKLDGYEAILSKQKYFAGNEITLADLFHLPGGAAIFEKLNLGDSEKRPNVSRWWNDISSQPSWQAVKDWA